MAQVGGEVSNVVAFMNTIPPGEANPDIVAELEALLKEAKSGSLRAIAYATFSEGDYTGTGWVGSDGTRHPLSSCIAMLQHRYSECLLRGSE